MGFLRITSALVESVCNAILGPLNLWHRRARHISQRIGARELRGVSGFEIGLKLEVAELVNRVLPPDP